MRTQPQGNSWEPGFKYFLFLMKSTYLNLCSSWKMKANIRFFICATQFPPFGTTVFLENRWKNWKSQLSLPRTGKNKNGHPWNSCIHAYFLPTFLFFSCQFQHFLRFSTCPSCGMETLFMGWESVFSLPVIKGAHSSTSCCTKACMKVNVLKCSECLQCLC